MQGERYAAATARTERLLEVVTEQGAVAQHESRGEDRSRHEDGQEDQGHEQGDAVVAATRGGQEGQEALGDAPGRGHEPERPFLELGQAEREVRVGQIRRQVDALAKSSSASSRSPLSSRSMPWATRASATSSRLGMLRSMRRRRISWKARRASSASPARPALT